MTLSIRAAAAEHPSAIGLMHASRSYSFAELAALTEAIDLRPGEPYRAPSELETVLRLYASLERGRSLALVSASLRDEELALRREELEANDCSDALVLFTSGSQGRAKGVLLGHDALLASAAAANERLGFCAGARWLDCLPLNHIGGLSILSRCLLARRTAVLAEGFEAEQVIQSVTEDRITHISLVPTMLWRLLEAGFRSPPWLHTVLLGGAAASEALLLRAEQAGLPIVTSYGSTETSSMVVAEGRVLQGVEMRVRDGLLELKSPTLMRGYLPPDSAPIADNWFRTEDRAHIDEHGLLHILGRADAMVISGGENIDPRRVEAALDACPQIRASLALGLSHQEWGQILVALVVAEREICVNELELPGLLDFEHPKTLCRVDELPLLENAKVDMRRAREIAQEHWDRKRHGG